MMTKRLQIRAELNELYIPIYDALCNQLPEYFQPIAGFRSFSSQDSLYAKGRTEPGLIVTRARGGQSPHNYGCATDWALFEDGKPVWEIRDKRWKEYESACAKAGALWGGTFGDYPHNELALKVRWKEICKIYESLSNSNEIFDHIKRNLA